VGQCKFPYRFLHYNPVYKKGGEERGRKERGEKRNTNMLISLSTKQRGDTNKVYPTGVMEKNEKGEGGK